MKYAIGHLKCALKRTFKFAQNGISVFVFLNTSQGVRLCVHCEKLNLLESIEEI